MNVLISKILRFFAYIKKVILNIFAKVEKWHRSFSITIQQPLNVAFLCPYAQLWLFSAVLVSAIS